MSVVLADTHVHIYPDYDPTTLLNSALRNLARLSPPGQDTRLVLFLTERAGHAAFRALRNRTLACPGWTVSATGHDWELELRHGDGGALTLVAGRQLSIRGGLELLALGVDAAFEEGLPLTEAMAAVKATGGVPVLNWSPGKWMFKRGQVVREVLTETPPESLLVGDVAMRPRGFPLPPSLRYAVNRRFRIIAGSDPLPIAGEEIQVGGYATRFRIPEPGPVNLRDLLLDPRVEVESTGCRNRLIKAAVRWLRNQAVR